MKSSINVLALVLLLLFTACGGGEKKAGSAEGMDTGAIEQLAQRGQEIFRDRHLGESGVACMDCHTDYDEDGKNDGRVRAGHSILGAHTRAQTWNGEFTGNALRRTAAGAAKCAFQFQARGKNIETALSEQEAAALMAFYAYISPADEPPMLTWTAVTYPGDPDFNADAFDKEIETIEKLRGDAMRGEKVFGMACAFCHENGLGPAMRVVKRKVEHLPRAVRSGDETMPFFSRDKLTDQDIADIKAFIAR
ncbi:MAG: cytochrome c [Bacteroidetes bacterium]|nr:cytochrome c [Bacteroidota bacterium]